MITFTIEKKNMKKSIIYVLIFLLVFPIEVEHVINFIPTFVSHYQDHKKEEQSITIFDFIKKHTIDYHHNTGKNEKNEKRTNPINHNHTVVNINLAFTDPSIQPQMNEIVFESERKEMILEKNKTFSSTYLSTIWQPPKFC